MRESLEHAAFEQDKKRHTEGKVGASFEFSSQGERDKKDAVPTGSALGGSRFESELSAPSSKPVSLSGKGSQPINYGFSLDRADKEDSKDKRETKSDVGFSFGGSLDTSSGFSFGGKVPSTAGFSMSAGTAISSMPSATQKGKWRCACCETTNPDTSSVCDTCLVPRAKEAEVKKERKESEDTKKTKLNAGFAFGGSSDTNSGFSFGGKVPSAAGFSFGASPPTATTATPSINSLDVSSQSAPFAAAPSGGFSFGSSVTVASNISKEEINKEKAERPVGSIVSVPNTVGFNFGLTKGPSDTKSDTTGFSFGGSQSAVGAGSFSLGSLTPPATAQTGWSCACCTEVNPETSNTCSTCLVPRPAQKEEEKKEPSFGTGSFSFGTSAPSATVTKQEGEKKELSFGTGGFSFGTSVPSAVVTKQEEKKKEPSFGTGSFSFGTSVPSAVIEKQEEKRAPLDNKIQDSSGSILGETKALDHAAPFTPFSLKGKGSNASEKLPSSVFSTASISSELSSLQRAAEAPPTLEETTACSVSATDLFASLSKTDRSSKATGFSDESENEENSDQSEDDSDSEKEKMNNTNNKVDVSIAPASLSFPTTGLFAQSSGGLSSFSLSENPGSFSFGHTTPIASPFGGLGTTFGQASPLGFTKNEKKGTLKPYLVAHDFLPYSPPIPFE